MEHLRVTLKLLKKHKLYAGLSKCDFYKDIIHFFGHIISDRVISGDPERIGAMMSQLASRKLKDVRSFVGLVGYCRKFIEEDFVGKVESMYRLRKPAFEHVVP